MDLIVLDNLSHSTKGRVDFANQQKSIDISRLVGPTTPGCHLEFLLNVFRFGLFRFRSPLLTESSFLSFPVGT